MNKQYVSTMITLALWIVVSMGTLGLAADQETTACHEQETPIAGTLTIRTVAPQGAEAEIERFTVIDFKRDVRGSGEFLFITHYPSGRTSTTITILVSRTIQSAEFKPDPYTHRP